MSFPNVNSPGTRREVTFFSQGGSVQMTSQNRSTFGANQNMPHRYSRFEEEQRHSRFSQARENMIESNNHVVIYSNFAFRSVT